jgi:hypothetical protein
MFIEFSRLFLEGKCSICGEPYDMKPYAFGVGDRMYRGKIVRTYRQAAIIPITVIVSSCRTLIDRNEYCSYPFDNDNYILVNGQSSRFVRISSMQYRCSSKRRCNTDMSRSQSLTYYESYDAISY